jgi:hypothetical protein
MQRDLWGDVEEPNEPPHPRRSGGIPPWSAYGWLPLEDVPGGVLLYHLENPDVSGEIKATIRQELRWRLEELQAWADREEETPR